MHDSSAVESSLRRSAVTETICPDVVSSNFMRLPRCVRNDGLDKITIPTPFQSERIPLVKSGENVSIAYPIAVLFKKK